MNNKSNPFRLNTINHLDTILICMYIIKFTLLKRESDCLYLVVSMTVLSDTHQTPNINRYIHIGETC